MRMVRKPGFSLVEILIYTAAVGVVMVSITLMAVATLSVRSKVRTTVILSENYRLAMNRLVSLVNQASAISSPGVGLTANELNLIMSESGINPTIINLQNGTIFVRQGSGQAMPLTSNEVDISSIKFERVSSTTPIVRVVVSGALRNADPSYPTLTVTTTAVVRQ